MWDDGEPIYYIRKRDLKVKDEFSSFFGFNVETIKQLNKEQFEIFLGHKESFEKTVL